MGKVRFRIRMIAIYTMVSFAICNSYLYVSAAPEGTEHLRPRAVSERPQALDKVFGVVGGGEVSPDRPREGVIEKDLELNVRNTFERFIKAYIPYLREFNVRGHASLQTAQNLQTALENLLSALDEVGEGFEEKIPNVAHLKTFVPEMIEAVKNYIKNYRSNIQAGKIPVGRGQLTREIEVITNFLREKIAELLLLSTPEGRKIFEKGEKETLNRAVRDAKSGILGGIRGADRVLNAFKKTPAGNFLSTEPQPPMKEKLGPVKLGPVEPLGKTLGQKASEQRMSSI